MKRVLGLALLGLGLGGTLRAQTVTAAVGGELTGQRFNTVLVPIAVDMTGAGGAKLGSYTARLTWNTAGLNFYNALAGNFPPPQVNSDSVGFGILKFTSISPVGATGLVTLAQMLFYVPDTVGSPLTLSFSEMSAAGTYTNLLPSLAVTSATFCPSRGLWGDIDRDGASNSRDALLILSKVVGLPVDTIMDTVSTAPLIVDTTFFDSGLGDVNADGAVTSVDALIILSTAVGIPIPGQRVLVLAPGGCGTGSPKTLAVFPSTAQLAPGQTYQLLAQGRDSAGRVVTLSNATWRSSNLNVAGVDADGTVHPRAPGTAFITAAVGPGISATGTVTVAPRSKWYVDVSVTGAQVQFGTQLLPFDNPLRAFSVVQEGDTIAVAPGTYDFVDYGILNVGVVIQGGTLGDTTTRPVFRDASPGSTTALEFDGGQRALVENIAFLNFSYAVDLRGVLSFALEDARISGSQYLNRAIYSCWSGVMDSVRIDRTEFLGDSLYRSPTAINFDGCDNGVALKTLTVRDSKIRFYGDGIYLYDVDSIAVIRTQILDNNGYGIASYQENGVVHPALYVAHSAIARNSSQGIYGYPYRRVVVDSTGIEATSDGAIDVEGDCPNCTPLMQLALHGDTIVMAQNANDYDWLQALSADTVLMDRTRLRFPADTSFYVNSRIEARQAIVTRSQFLNLGNGTAFNFLGGRLFADSVTMTGCAVASCDQTTGINLGFNEGGPQFESATVQRSSFTQLAYAVEGYAGGVQTVADNVVDSTSSAFQLYGDSITATHNVITRAGNGGLGVYTYGGAGFGPSVVAGDTITCSAGNTGRGIDLDQLVVHVQDNLVIGCYTGIWANRSQPGSVLSRNTIRLPYDGIVVNQTDTTTMRVDSNGVSGATDAAVARLNGGRLSMTHNNISGNVYGVFFAFPYYGATVHELHDNSFTGNTQYAVVDSSSGDSVHAQSNWWGSSSGSGGGVGDSVFGNVDATAFLGAPPAGLPGLAPRFLATAAPVRTARPPAAATYTRLRPAVRPVRVAPLRQRPALRIPPRMRADRAAVLEESARRRVAQDAKDAARARGVTRP